MKVGDTVYCIQNYRFLRFKYGNCYKITKLVFRNSKTQDELIYIKVDDYIFNVKFSETSNRNFDDYFISLKEYRKLKLQNLKDITLN